MRRTAYLVLLLLAGWVGCWLLPGLMLGSPTALLTGDAPEGARVSYLAALYAWLLVGTRWAWARWGPRRLQAYPWRLARLFGLGGTLGLATAALHRVVLLAGGWWAPAPPPAGLVITAILTAPALALAEEAVFRGYLFGVAREDLGRWPAYVVANGLFAVVHLARPGGLEFKLGYGCGLFLSGLVLSLVVERSGHLWTAAGIHAGWILAALLEGPGAVRPGLPSGLGGEPAAGLIGWVLLVGLAVAFVAGRQPGGRSPRPEP